MHKSICGLTNELSHRHASCLTASVTRCASDNCKPQSAERQLETRRLTRCAAPRKGEECPPPLVPGVVVGSRVPFRLLLSSQLFCRLSCKVLDVRLIRGCGMLVLGSPGLLLEGRALGCFSVLLLQRLAADLVRPKPVESWVQLPQLRRHLRRCREFIHIHGIRVTRCHSITCAHQMAGSKPFASTIGRRFTRSRTSKAWAFGHTGADQEEPSRWQD